MSPLADDRWKKIGGDERNREAEVVATNVEAALKMENGKSNQLAGVRDRCLSLVIRHELRLAHLCRVLDDTLAARCISSRNALSDRIDMLCRG